MSDFDLTQAPRQSKEAVPIGGDGDARTLCIAGMSRPSTLFLMWRKTPGERGAWAADAIGATVQGWQFNLNQIYAPAAGGASIRRSSRFTRDIDRENPLGCAGGFLLGRGGGI